ncbi:MAG TPA: hypothetical protein VM285_02615, partial [Polyangia bacterium]|nr:hypothetical protein [Polyangia bacterium]
RGTRGSGGGAVNRCPCIAAGLLAALALLGATAGKAVASEARSLSLAASPLVDDEIDIVDFPGMITTYSDLVFLNIGPALGSLAGPPDQASMTGSLGALFGREVALGLWIHRTPRFDDLAETDRLFELEAPLPTTYHLADLFLGFGTGFGLRLGIAAGLESDDEFDEDGDPVSTGGSTFAADLQLGYSFDSGQYHGDFGAGLQLSYFELLRRGDTTYDGGLVPSFLFRHRSIIGSRRDLAGVIDLVLTRRSYTAASRAEDGDLEQSGAFGRWLLDLSAGPRLRFPDIASFWLGLRFAFENLSGEIEKQEQPTLRGIVFPGLSAALEVTPLEVLAVRAGASYDITFAVSERPLPDDVDETDAEGLDAGARTMDRRFSWTTGLGLLLGDFRVDATVSQGFYTAGPYLLSGNQSGFLGVISGSYAW